MTKIENRELTAAELDLVAGGLENILISNYFMGSATAYASFSWSESQTAYGYDIRQSKPV
jgi:hypothetical protein